LEEANYGGGFDDDRNGADVVVILLDHFDFPQKHHADSTFPGDDFERFEARVQK
jgi:hypothetical protein